MKPNYVMWCDLETTGLDIHTDHICEVAVIFTRGIEDKFEELWRYSCPISLDPDGWKALISDTFVHNMHLSTGLVQDMVNNGRHIYTVMRVIREKMQQIMIKDKQVSEQSTLLEWQDVMKSVKGAVALGGSGVSHFDLHFIRRLMPDVMALLDWKPLDVGQLEEWRELVGLDTYEQAFPEETARKTHRAMDDISMALDEAKWYVDIS